MKQFNPKPWFLPQTVIIIGTYDEDGTPDVEKMHLITFDPVHLGYLEIGQRVGNAFKDGAQLK